MLLVYPVNCRVPVVRPSTGTTDIIPVIRKKVKAEDENLPLFPLRKIFCNISFFCGINKITEHSALGFLNISIRKQPTMMHLIYDICPMTNTPLTIMHSKAFQWLSAIILTRIVDYSGSGHNLTPFSVQITVLWSDWEDCCGIGVKEWIELETHKFIFIGSQAIVTRLPSLHGKCSNSIIPLYRSRNISKLTLLLLKHQKKFTIATLEHIIPLRRRGYLCHSIRYFYLVKIWKNQVPLKIALDMLRFLVPNNSDIKFHSLALLTVKRTILRGRHCSRANLVNGSLSKLQLMHQTLVINMQLNSRTFPFSLSRILTLNLFIWIFQRLLRYSCRVICLH